MLLNELFTLKTLNESTKVGRLYQHPEDLVFIEGSTGALRILKLFDSYNKNLKDISVKWDGSPTIFWGRDSNGDFVLVGKNNWDKEHLNGKSKSPDELRTFIMSRGKAESWREKFANDIANLWHIFEKATPKNFRGYVYGDLLFFPGSNIKKSKDKIKFVPNITQYEVLLSSSLGKKLNRSSVAVVAHEYLETFGQSLGSSEPVKDVKKFNTQDLVVLGQTYVSHQIDLDTKKIQALKDFTHKHKIEIDNFLMSRNGLADLKKILYTYISQSAKTKNLAVLGNRFFTWLESSNVSESKQYKIKSLTNQYPTALPSILYLVREIMMLKDELILQLDTSDHEVKATTNDQIGGEGYISHSEKLKLVPRERWIPYRSN